MALVDLPFSSLSDIDLLHNLECDTPFMPSSYNEFRSLYFDPFTIHDEKYNNNLDVNYFYKHSRSLSVPKSKYVFLDSFNFPICNGTITLLSLNIRSIPSNLQHFTDSVLSISNASMKFDILGFTETRLD